MDQVIHMPSNKKRIVCISASNTYSKGEASTSTKVCKLIERIIIERTSQIEIEIIQLMKMKIKFCLLCGDCFEEGECPFDNDFNQIFQKAKEADAVFLVVPCYTPVPAKLAAVFEKIDENLYGNLLRIPQYRSPFYDKAAAVIGHGGMAESKESLDYYHDRLITPVANALTSFGFNVIGYNDEFPMGVPFGLRDDTCIQPSEDSIFPDILQDWSHIENRIKPLVEKVLAEIKF
jgi:multimeric flavodoxin WrbA